MTLAHLPSLSDHSTLHNVSWLDYERVLKRVGNRHIRVTYCDGSMEIMSPLPEHEDIADAIGNLVRDLAVEQGLTIRGFGSTTYRRKDIKAGLEPDKCYYIQNELKVRGMKRFDSSVHPPPDLAIEIDVTSRSVKREPIYAHLGVPELWRYSRQRIAIRSLASDKEYVDANVSSTFPYLPMREFETFVQRMIDEDTLIVSREFREWAKKLGSK